jgi:hypothetical protein
MSISPSKRAVLALLAGASLSLAQQPPPAAPPKPTPQQIEIQKLSTEDRQHMLDLLKITELRVGPVSRVVPGGQPGRLGPANFDEALANPYDSLPDPLKLKNGKKVTSASMWWHQRRAEIMEDFDREVYGRTPKNTPKVKWEVTSSERGMNGDIPILTRQVVGRVDNSSYPAITVEMQLTVTTPAEADGRAPVMLEFGGFGPGAAIPGRGPLPPPEWHKLVLAKGWGYARLVPGSVQADNGAGLTKGIIGLVNKGQRRKPDDWGSLKAWAWGASRALDFFESDKYVDGKRVGITGHSRYGKAAGVAMAYDPRFAIAFISSPGEGGMKIHRRNYGERVENVAAFNEYHWMAGNFLKYAGPLTANDLPVDSHELIAMCAPRPVFLGAGSTEGGDGWVDARGTFLAGVHAGPVYRLLGKKDLGTTEYPPMEAALIEGEIGFRQHSGGHTQAPNWATFIAFAERYFSGPVKTSRR